MLRQIGGWCLVSRDSCDAAPSRSRVDVERGTSSRITLSGEFDMVALPALYEALLQAVGSRGDVVIDGSQVTFIDAGTVGVLVHAQRRFATYGGTLVVVDPSPVMQRMFQLLNITDLEIHPPDNALSTG
jgi:anti-anti-sigma factor